MNATNNGLLDAADQINISNDDNNNEYSIRRRKLKKSREKGSSWKVQEPAVLTPAQETVFLNMQLRKMNRAMTGTKTRSMRFEFTCLAVFLVIAYSAASQTKMPGTDDEIGKDFNLHTPFITLSFGQVILIGLWIFLATIITSLWKESNFIALLYWMLIYLPLMAMIVTLLFHGEAEAKLSYFGVDGVIGILLAVAEVITAAFFVGLYYLYPKFICSKWFDRTSRASQWWKINVVTEWTMTYLGSRGRFGKRFTCKYNGKTNEQGLPHGFGRWFDDSYDGEIMTGSWKDGSPVAPFYSRHYGRGDAFSAIRIGYIMASDDDFNSNKFWPTNEKQPRCGVVSVECSVSGSFYNELPEAAHLYGPFSFGEEWTVEDICRHLSHIGKEGDIHALQVRADPKGIHVKQHVYGRTGHQFDPHVGEILIKVVRNKGSQKTQTRPGLDFMPRTSERSFMLKDQVILKEELESSSNVSEMLEVDESPNASEEMEEALAENDRSDETASLIVQDWIPTMHKEALIYFPGFNSCQKHSLETLGQFIAMTKLDSQVYPICFAWPSAQVLSYHLASRASATKRNRENLLQLLRGLQEAGISTVNLMSHSMGVQTMIGAFEDESDGSRSDVSLCFRKAGDFGANAETIDDKLLFCKTITMLNPDFPLEAFVKRAFKTIRRVCSTITMVADRNDGALFWSQLVNGIAVFVGYEQPPVLRSDMTNRKRQLGYQKVVGKNVEALHLPKETSKDQRLGVPLFRSRPPIILRPEDEEYDQLWLDMDVIDTTGLDTNIAGIRHSAFNLNPILFKDLEDLITTGLRASKRSALLYREGNIFSYCHAPSFVVIQ